MTGLATTTGAPCAVGPFAHAGSSPAAATAMDAVDLQIPVPRPFGTNCPHSHGFLAFTQSASVGT